MLTIRSKTSPANDIPFFVKYLGLAPLHCQVQIAVISVDAMLPSAHKKIWTG